MLGFSTSISRSCATIAARCSAPAITVSGAKRSEAEARSAASWKRVCSPVSGIRCFGAALRESGHKRTPAPPDRSTGKILSVTTFTASYGLTCGRSKRSYHTAGPCHPGSLGWGLSMPVAARGALHCRFATFAVKLTEGHGGHRGPGPKGFLPPTNRRDVTSRLAASICQRSPTYVFARRSRDVCCTPMAVLAQIAHCPPVETSLAITANGTRIGLVLRYQGHSPPPATPIPDNAAS